MSRCFRTTAELRSRIEKSHPFLEYAIHGIVTHANASQSLGFQQQDFIRDFPLDTWVRLHNGLVINPADRVSERAGREYIFVIKNALALVEVLINQESQLTSTRCDTKGERYQSLLGAAVANGYSGMAALLLENGADPNAPVNSGFKCLDTAAMQGNAEIVHKLLESGVAVQGSASDHQITQPSPLHRAAESGRTDVVRILLAHPTYAAQWHTDMDCVLEAAIYRHDGGMIQLLYERMHPVKRMIVRALYAAHDHYAARAERESGTFRALHSFRLYYQTRERCEPVLDRICKAHEDHIRGMLRSANISENPRVAAAMVIVNQVQTLLKHQTMRLPAPIQLGRRLVVLEDRFGRFHCIDTTFMLEWNKFIHHIDRAYHTRHGRGLVCSADPDTYNDERHLGYVWPLRESDSILRLRPSVTNSP